MDYKELIYRLRYKMVCSNDIVEAATAIKTLLAEREAAVEDMRGNCGKCVNRDVSLDCQPCLDCRYGVFVLEPKADHWQWRGHTPPEQDSKEE